MLPDNTYSTVPVSGLFLSPDDYVTTPLVDYEIGGVELLDASQGLMRRIWKCWLQNDLQVMLQGDGGEPVLLFEAPQITELALCFDQNMRWSVGYVQQGVLKLNWYDSSVSDRVVTVFADAANPKMALDDKRESQLINSDMILAYIRGNALYYRQQRDRFLIERLLRSNLFPGTKLKGIGMSNALRLQFELV